MAATSSAAATSSTWTVCVTEATSILLALKDLNFLPFFFLAKNAAASAMVEVFGVLVGRPMRVADARVHRRLCGWLGGEDETDDCRIRDSYYSCRWLVLLHVNVE